MDVTMTVLQREASKSYRFLSLMSSSRACRQLSEAKGKEMMKSNFPFSSHGLHQYLNKYNIWCKIVIITLCYIIVLIIITSLEKSMMLMTKQNRRKRDRKGQALRHIMWLTSLPTQFGERKRWRRSIKEVERKRQDRSQRGERQINIVTRTVSLLPVSLLIQSRSRRTRPHLYLPELSESSSLDPLIPSFLPPLIKESFDPGKISSSKAWDEDCLRLTSNVLDRSSMSLPERWCVLSCLPVYITHLRRKIRSNRSSSQVRTVPGKWFSRV